METLDETDHIKRMYISKFTELKLVWNSQRGFDTQQC